MVVTWLLLYAQSLWMGLIDADLPMCALLISICSSFLINFKGMFLFGIVSHSFHIIDSGDK